MKTGFPVDLVMKYNMTQAEQLIRHGQDVAGALLRCGLANHTCWTPALSVCPRGADTSKQVCVIKPA